jgi:hypothetical protein
MPPPPPKHNTYVVYVVSWFKYETSFLSWLYFLFKGMARYTEPLLDYGVHRVPLWPFVTTKHGYFNTNTFLSPSSVTPMS